MAQGVTGAVGKPIRSGTGFTDSQARSSWDKHSDLRESHGLRSDGSGGRGHEGHLGYYRTSRIYIMYWFGVWGQ